MKYEITSFFRSTIDNYSLIFSMGKRDFISKYKGSIVGSIWGLIQPLVTVLVYWYVFEFGLKASPISGDTPFFIWMLTGLLPWFYFSDALSGGTTVILEYSYLVKKVMFNIKMLPVVKLISALYMQIIFSLIFLIILLFYGYTPSLYWLQAIFYFCLMWFFLRGLVLVTSALAPFFRDITQIVNIILQIGFWVTPIIWNYDILPKKYTWLVNFNPMFYIVEGYRNSFLSETWIWELDYKILIFLGAVVLLNILGNMLFSKIKSLFADVL